jgi:predicted amidohydrolase
VLHADTPRVVPCGNGSYDDQPALQVLSCAARAGTGVTLVVGGVEVLRCSPGDNGCPSDGRWLYNSAFTFAPNGSVISVTRKTHLFVEAGCLDAAQIRPTTFPVSVDASHTVNVGVVICYDIEYSANVEGALSAGADVLAVLMNWMNTIPVSSAQALQQAVSYHYNTTIVAVSDGRVVVMWVG